MFEKIQKKESEKWCSLPKNEELYSNSDLKLPKEFISKIQLNSPNMVPYSSRLALGLKIKFYQWSLNLILRIKNWKLLFW